MVKKILALAMVIGVLGAFLAGCAKEETAPDTTTPPATTGGETTGS